MDVYVHQGNGYLRQISLGAGGPSSLYFLVELHYPGSSFSLSPVPYAGLFCRCSARHTSLTQDLSYNDMRRPSHVGYNFLGPSAPSSAGRGKGLPTSVLYQGCGYRRLLLVSMVFFRVMQL